MPVEDVETVGVDRWDDCRATWVDVDNGRETRSSELVAAWREQGIDLVRTREAIELPADVVEDLGLDAEGSVEILRELQVRPVV